MWKNESNELENSGERNLLRLVVHVVSKLPAETRVLQLAYQEYTYAAKDFSSQKHQRTSVNFPW